MRHYQIDPVDGPVVRDDGQQFVALTDTDNCRVKLDVTAKDVEQRAALFRSGWIGCLAHLKELGVELPQEAAVMDA